MINVLGLEVHSEREALSNILDSLSIAENAARQMAMYCDRPQWMLVAQKLGDMRQLCSTFGQASFNTRSLLPGITL